MIIDFVATRIIVAVAQENDLLPLMCCLLTISSRFLLNLLHNVAIDAAAMMPSMAKSHKLTSFWIIQIVCRNVTIGSSAYTAMLGEINLQKFILICLFILYYFCWFFLQVLNVFIF